MVASSRPAPFERGICVLKSRSFKALPRGWLSPAPRTWGWWCVIIGARSGIFCAGEPTLRGPERCDSRLWGKLLLA